MRGRDVAASSLPPSALLGVNAAVLLVDTRASRVLSANQQARALAPGLRLPCGVDAWSEVVGLRTPDGQPLREAEHPLARLAEGTPVDGELVGVGPGGEDDGPPPRLLWVVGLPVAGEVPEALSDRAVVVLAEVAAGPDVDDAEEQQAAADRAKDLGRQARAFYAAPLSLALSDPSRPDDPLVWVNQVFTATTGYEEAEVVGRNCRLLQGPGTDPDAVRRLREGLRSGEPVHVTLLNYRKDGRPFWNELSVSPVLDGEGRIVNHVGVQRDVTVQVEAENARAEALRAVERARDRLALLLQASDALTTLDPDEAVAAVPDVVVPALASVSAVFRVQRDRGVLHRVAHRDVDPDRCALFTGLDPDLPLDGDAPMARVVRTGEALQVDGTDDPGLAGTPAERLDVYRRAGVTRMLFVPLRLRDRLLGVLALGRTAEDPPFDDDEVGLARDLGARAALALDNAEMHARETSAAEAFQRSLLPTLPRVPGLELAARYAPSDDHAQVGGDWFDVLPLPDGSVGICIGDVMGHDLAAAAAMGQLRSVLRSYAYEGLTPATVLERLDQLVQALGMAQLATAVYARLERADGWGLLRYVSAGHLPLMLRQASGEVVRLDRGRGLVIGMTTPERRTEGAAPLAPGDLLVLFTDGLVESRHRPLDDGLDRLEEMLREVDLDDVDVEALCDRLLEELVPVREDDVALLVVRMV